MRPTVERLLCPFVCLDQITGCFTRLRYFTPCKAKTSDLQIMNIASEKMNEAISQFISGVLLSTKAEISAIIPMRRGKGRKQHIVMLMNETRKELAEWLNIRLQAQSDCFFIGQVGEAIQPRHVLRHTFAWSLLDSGTMPFEVAKLLGHSSLDFTACLGEA
jgi:site-specific recombinase XerC